MRRILGVAIKIISGGIFILAFLCYKGALALSDKQGDDALIVFCIAVILSFIGPWGWKVGKKMSLPSLESILNKDKRPPILYLRSFIHDNKASKSPQDGFLIKLMPTIPQNLLSEEEQIEQVMVNYGPFIAIGKPGELLPQLGASRLYASDEEWQAIVLTYIKQAQLIILRVGNTDGFWWEVKKVLECGTQNIVFLLPEEYGEYMKFKAKIDNLLPKPLPENYNPNFLTEHSFGGVLWFDLDWTPHIELSKNSFNKVNFNISYDLNSSLAVVLKRLHKIEFVQASINHRLSALFVDLIIFVCIVCLCWFGIDYFFENKDLELLKLLIIPLFFPLYFGILESTSLLATPGKKIFKLTTRHNSGIPISFFQGFIRAFFKFIELASMLWLISIILLLRKEKPIHDLILKTNVFSIKNNVNI